MIISASRAPCLVECRRERTREHLDRAAVGLLATQGDAQTTMAQIADRADTARATVFNPVPTKGHLTLEWTRRHRGRAARALAAVGGDLPVADQVSAYLREMAATNEREHALTVQMVRGWVRDGGSRRHIGPDLDPLVSLVVGGLMTTVGEQRPGRGQAGG